MKISKILVILVILLVLIGCVLVFAKNGGSKEENFEMSVSDDTIKYKNEEKTSTINNVESKSLEQATLDSSQINQDDKTLIKKDNAVFSGEDQLFGSGQVFAVVLTNKGFDPKELRVKQGDTVFFKNSSENNMWIYQIVQKNNPVYSELNSGEEVLPGRGFNFIFTKTGTWIYGDKLKPDFTGTIIVTK